MLFFLITSLEFKSVFSFELESNFFICNCNFLTAFEILGFSGPLGLIESLIFSVIPVLQSHVEGAVHVPCWHLSQVATNYL